MELSNFAFFCQFNRGLKGTSKSVLYRCIWNENLIFKPKLKDNTTALTRDALENLTFCLSFQYGTATKAPRLPAVLQYAARLSNVAIGFVDYLFMGKPEYSLHDDDVYRKANGDGRILPAFNPFYGGNEDDAESFVPFHPHVSA